MREERFEGWPWVLSLPEQPRTERYEDVVEEDIEPEDGDIPIGVLPGTVYDDAVDTALGWEADWGTDPDAGARYDAAMAAIDEEWKRRYPNG